jgi:hypothetical protein
MFKSLMKVHANILSQMSATNGEKYPKLPLLKIK